MNKDEAVQKLATVGRLSIAHAEDLYDSLFEKPVVPQYAADWYEENKEDFETNLFNDIYNISNVYPGDNLGEFADWLMADDSHALTTLVNMHQFGYEVEEEPRYMVRVKGISGNNSYLNQEDGEDFLFADSEEFGDFRAKFTRKELEANGFGWVFNCQGVEVKEVTDE
nr:MAG TPA: Protein of unknown function (DUF1642) [Caudoviricetes sp.]